MAAKPDRRGMVGSGDCTWYAWQCAGIEGHYSNSFLDLLMDDDGDLHVATVIADSGYYGNQSEILGLYDIHQEQGVWTAALICDGTYIYANEFWDPSDLYTDGGSWMHSPSLAIHPDGTMFAA